MIHKYGIECEFLFMPQTRVMPALAVLGEDLVSTIGTDGDASIGEVRTSVYSNLAEALKEAYNLLCKADSIYSIVLQHPDYQLGLHINFDCDKSNVNTKNIKDVSNLIYETLSLFDISKRFKGFGTPDHAFEAKDFGYEFIMFPAKFILVKNINYLFLLIEGLISAERDSNYHNALRLLKKICNMSFSQSMIFIKNAPMIVSLHNRKIIDDMFNFISKNETTILYSTMPHYKGLPNLYFNIDYTESKTVLKELHELDLYVNYNFNLMYNQVQVSYKLINNYNLMSNIHTILSKHISKIQTLPTIDKKLIPEIKNTLNKLTKINT